MPHTPKLSDQYSCTQLSELLSGQIFTPKQASEPSSVPSGQISYFQPSGTCTRSVPAAPDTVAVSVGVGVCCGAPVVCVPQPGGEEHQQREEQCGEQSWLFHGQAAFLYNCMVRRPHSTNVPLKAKNLRRADASAAGGVVRLKGLEPTR